MFFIIIFLIISANPHYRIINSPMQHGVRSTLIIKQAIASDFGPYTCAIQNEHGVSELRIELEEKSKFFTSDHSHIYLYTSLNSVCFY